MRIITGSLGGRTFDSPRGYRTHPMSEKIRGAIFNALGDISGLTVLDPFTGSGALCFEAISRGASKAIGIDNDKTAYKTALKNSSNLGIAESVKITNAYAESWSRRHQNEYFDLVFLDPPFDNLQVEVAEKLAMHTKPGGIAVFSLPPSTRLIVNEKLFSFLRAKEYGDARLYFYKRI